MKSPIFHRRAEEIFTQALASERGLRVECEDQAAATRLRHQLNSFRSYSREQSKDIYPPSDERHGKTDYDSFEIIREAPNVLIIRGEFQIKIAEL